MDVVPVADDFREWAANLPYVLERTHRLANTVRMYDVDCEPLGQRKTWLILDFATPDSRRPSRIAAVLPRTVARKATRAGWGCSDGSAPVDGHGFESASADRVVFVVNPHAGRQNVETVVLGAYRSVIDWT